MPLKKGSDDATIQDNIRELIHSGHPADQAEAIAYKMAGRARDIDHSTHRRKARRSDLLGDR